MSDAKEPGGAFDAWQPYRIQSTSHETVFIYWCDVVSFSQYSDDDQLRIIATIQELLGYSALLAAINPNQWVFIPTGDGCAVAFLPPADALSPLRLAIELQTSAKARGGFELRAGIHAGRCTVVRHAGGSGNVYGDPMNMTARVADLGGPNQILCSGAFYQLCLQRNAEFAPALQDYGLRRVKHGVTIPIFNVYRPDSFGSAARLRGRPLRVRNLRVDKSNFLAGYYVRGTLLNLTDKALEVEIVVVQSKVDGNQLVNPSQLSAPRISLTPGTSQDFEVHCDLGFLPSSVWHEHVVIRDFHTKELYHEAEFRF